jgi:hypothetical protein
MAGSAIAYVVSDFVGAAAGAAIADVAATALAETVISGALIVDASYAVGALVGLAAGQIVGGAVNELIGGSGGGSTGAGGGVTGAGSSAPSVSAARAQGSLLNIASNVEAIPVIYGARKVGGSRPLIELSAVDSNYLNIIITLCEGEIDSVTQVYINDIPWTDARFTGLVQLETYVGTDSQSASAALIADLGGKWTSAHTGSGVAYLYLRLKFDANVFGGLPTITADVRGKKVYDPRSGLTVWSNNPALCIRDYLTNIRYGRGLTMSAAEDAAISLAANHCDEVVSVPGDTQVRYTLDGVIDINQTLFDNIKSMMSACRGSLVYSGGAYKLIVDKLWTTTPFAFTEDNITGDWTIVQPGKRSKFNRVTAGFFNSAANWQPDFGISDSPTYRALDNALLLESKIDFPFTANIYRAQQLAGLVLKQSRFGVNVRFTALQEGLRAEVGDVVSITHSTPAWTAKKFRVTQIDIKNSDEVEVTAYEYDDTVYNLNTLTAVTGAPSSNLPNVFARAALDGLQAFSGTAQLTVGTDGTVISRILLGWYSVADPFILAGSVQIEYQKSGDTQWSQVTARGDATYAYITGVTDSVAYTIRARYENSIGVRGPWSTITHTVIGKTAPPPDVTTFTIDGSRLTWGQVAALDLAGYEIRFNYGVNTWWPTDALLQQGIITDSPYILSQKLQGVVTLLIKAVDTTGNYSVNPATIVVNLGIPTVSNLFVSWPEAPLFSSGVLTGGSVVGGTLQANALDLFFATAGEPMFSPDTDVFYPVGSYDTMVYSWSVTPTVLATLLLDFTIAASNYQIEYQRGDQGSFFGPALDYMFSPGTDPMFGTPLPWTVWPGSLNILTAEKISFRITTVGGATQGVVSVATPKLDVPDILESFNDLVISAGGTRLPLTKTYRVIENVQITVQADGNGGVTARIEDKNATLGPLIRVFNSAGTAVAGLVDIDIQGY